MADENKENISMTDNSDNPAPEAAEGKEASKGESEAWYSKPERFGESVGGKIQDTMAPVSNKTGPVLQTAAGPVGAVLDPVLGGVMKGGKAWGDTIGVGFGNAEGGPAKQQEAEHARMKEPLGGKEQTADNPLGL